MLPGWSGRHGPPLHLDHCFDRLGIGIDRSSGHDALWYGGWIDHHVGSWLHHHHAPPAASTTTTTAPAGLGGAWCVAVGTTASTISGTRTGHGVVLTTTDGGASWSSQPVSPTSATLMGVSCTAVNSCVAVGSAVALASEAGLSILTGPVGHPWRKAAAVASPQALTAVSCISQSRCVLVGESISQRLATG